MTRRRSRGFTTVELLVTVAIVAVVAAIAVPRLGSSGRKGVQAQRLAEDLSGQLERVRFKAVSSRQPYRIDFTPNAVETWYQRRSDGVWVRESTINAGTDALIWDLKYARATPTAPSSTAHNIRYNIDFTVIVDGGAASNANIYIGGMHAGSISSYVGPRYLISVVATGALKLWGGKERSAW